jgi:hypothetical protein
VAAAGRRNYSHQTFFLFDNETLAFIYPAIFAPAGELVLILKINVKML